LTMDEPGVTQSGSDHLHSTLMVNQQRFLISPACTPLHSYRYPSVCRGNHLMLQRLTTEAAAMSVKRDGCTSAAAATNGAM
jgi:hypothetical protein